MPSLIGAAPDVSVTFRETAADTSTKTTYTMAGMDIGADTVSHKVVVAACWSGGATFVSATIDGDSATAIDDAAGAGGNVRVQLFFVDDSTATTGDVVFVLSGGADRGGAASWDIRGAAAGTAATTAKDEDGSDPQTASLNTTTGGGCLGATCTSKTGAPNYVWTGLTEVYDEAVEGADFWQSGASLAITSGSTPLAVTANPDSLLEAALICAAFSKA